MNKMKNEMQNYNTTKKLIIKEGFDGIRKSNSRIIFIILLGIIIIDFIYQCILN
jgi:hypothetical protein